MTFMRLVYLVQSAVMLVYLARQIRTGYRRRRSYWTRGSWLRFTGVCVGGFLVAFAPVGAEIAVGFGLLSPEKLTADMRLLWALAGVALMVIGAAVIVATIGWFAKADPVRPFPGAKAHPAQSIQV